MPLGAGTAASRITAATRVISLYIPNSNSVTSAWQDYVTTAHQIELATSLTFFTALPPAIASALRYRTDGLTNPPPLITGFSPAGGAASTNVVLTGTNFLSALSVAFNGVAAAYTVDSNTQITATVPANATSGPITIKTPGGTVTSASSFVIGTVSGTADLAISSSHSGSFRQGDIGDKYTLLVMNLGVAASTGVVTLTNTLPAGLTATALSGAGWSADLNSLSCTRADSLAAGAGYPPITLTVNVSTGASTSLTNTATISGGGDTNLANNSASDPTTVQPAGPPLPVTGLATALTSTTAVLQGTINPNNQPATCWFEYGLTTAYGSTGAVSGTLTGTTAQSVSANLSGLNPSTTYHFRLDATNLLGFTSGLDQSFSTTTDSTGGGTGGTTTLAGWDVSTLTNKDYGPSPFLPTTNGAHLTIGGLTRGSGITADSNAALRTWGGLAFVDTSAAAAIAANRFATFSVTPNAGYKVSYSSLSRFDYRHSGTGPTNGLVQYQLGSGAFTDIATLAYSSSSSSGASLGPIDLTGISALQNVSAGTPVTFRIVNWNGGSGGTWYIFDVANNSATDLELQGTVSPIVVPAPDLALSPDPHGHFRPSRRRGPLHYHRDEPGHSRERGYGERYQYAACRAHRYSHQRHRVDG